jgi:hypothetical protein
VLDGEIVFNIKCKRNIFLVFDVLCNDGQPCAQLPFESRLSLISGSGNVMAKCARIRYKPGDEEPIWIIRKIFRPKNDLKELLKHLMVR